MWHGKLSRELGLEGEVTQEAFFALADFKHPATGEKLTQRKNDAAKARVGYDFTFSVPKSVSLLYSVTGDERILQAFEKSVAQTMGLIEGEAETRVRVGGAFENRTTGKMVWSGFTHKTARPEGAEAVPDPHLHIHAFAFNVTWDPVEEKRKAIEIGNIKARGDYFGTVADALLAEELVKLGYEIERTPGVGLGWEIKGVGRDLVELFSERTRKIEKLAAELGVEDVESKARLGEKTRQAKNSRYNETELGEKWDSRMSAEQRARLQKVYDDATGEGGAPGSPSQSGPDQGGPTFGSDFAARRAMDDALEHYFTRLSAVEEHKVLAWAMKRAIGKASMEQVHEAFSRSRVIRREVEVWTGTRIERKQWVTTPEVLAQEAQMLEMARLGQGIHEPLGKPGYKVQGELDPGQRQAVEHILSSRDGMIAIRGAAGSGKTRMMREAIPAIEREVRAQLGEDGRQVFTFAPTAEASRRKLREDGRESGVAALQQADTVYKLLNNQEVQSRVKGQVVWIDEAGLLGIQDMVRIQELSRTLGFRVILSGDEKQHSAVSRGDAIRVLRQQGTVVPVEIGQIYRQRGEYRDAVQQIADGDVMRGFEMLEKLPARDGRGGIREIEDAQQRYRQVANDYLEVTGMGASSMVVAPTHREGRAINQEIREGLRRAGRLNGPDREFTRLTNLSLTEPEKRDSARYQAGQVIQFTQNAPGFRAGERLQVIEKVDEGVFVREESGATAILQVERMRVNHFEVYHEDRMSLAVGDEIRVTQGGFTALDRGRVENGSRHKIKGIRENGLVEMESGKVLNSRFGHWTHGYVSTSHAAQGSDVQVVIGSCGKESMKAFNRESFYVMVSRGKDEIRFYTDDKAELKEAAQKSGARMSATEMVKPANENQPSKMSDDDGPKKVEIEPPQTGYAQEPITRKDVDRIAAESRGLYGGHERQVSFSHSMEEREVRPEMGGWKSYEQKRQEAKKEIARGLGGDRGVGGSNVGSPSKPVGQTSAKEARVGFKAQPERPVGIAASNVGGQNMGRANVVQLHNGTVGKVKEVPSRPGEKRKEGAPSRPAEKKPQQPPSRPPDRRPAETAVQRKPIVGPANKALGRKIEMEKARSKSMENLKMRYNLAQQGQWKRNDRATAMKPPPPKAPPRRQPVKKLKK